MDTIVKTVDDVAHHIEVIEEAANILLKGGLVAFPTETVYGLGAYAFNPTALKKIYAAKGRPSDNPLVVHVASEQTLRTVISDEPIENFEIAEKLMKQFWPGPLTLIMPKNKNIPYEATGGLETVAVRWPKNPIAQALIQKTGAIAAPSANSSGKPSPTRASHVILDLTGKIEMIVDGGSSDFGLDSTIIDITCEVPTILRPGSITREMLMDCIGNVETENANETDKPRAPGMKYTHYSPNANITIVVGSEAAVLQKIKQLADKPTTKIGILATDQTKNKYTNQDITVLSLGDRNKPEEIAKRLYDTLRQLDELQIQDVFAEGFDECGVGFAIMNRLKKAAGFQIIEA